MEREQDIDKEIDDGSERQEAPDTSVRGSIRTAIEQVSEGENDAADPPRRERVERKSTSKGDKESADNVDDSAQRKQQTKPKSDEEILSEEVETSEGKVTKPSSGLKPPVGWTKEAKIDWDSLAPDVQKSVLKREEEYSSGIKQYADKAKSYDEFEQAIAPYKQQIAGYGVTPIQTVGRLFQWMDALANPNPQNKAHAFLTLAKSFNFDVEQLFPKREITSGEENPQPQFDPSVIDRAMQERLAPIQSELQQFKTQQQQQQEQAAAAVLNRWAADKPHFEQVRRSMFNLIQSGEVPPKNGELDLDAAYNKAILLNDEVRASIEQEQKEAAEKLAAENAAKAAKEKAAKLANARKVGIGIKPVAPAKLQGSIPLKNNGKGPTSVRDSLMQTLREAREAE